MPNRTRPKPDTAQAELAHFSGFVRLLASKDEHQRQIIVQRAVQQAAAISSAISAGRFVLPNHGDGGASADLLIFLFFRSDSASELMLDLMLSEIWDLVVGESADLSLQVT